MSLNEEPIQLYIDCVVAGASQRVDQQSSKRSEYRALSSRKGKHELALLDFSLAEGSATANVRGFHPSKLSRSVVGELAIRGRCEARLLVHTTTVRHIADG
jgi:hypothetical protein